MITTISRVDKKSRAWQNVKRHSNFHDNDYVNDSSQIQEGVSSILSINLGQSQMLIRRCFDQSVLEEEFSDEVNDIEEHCVTIFQKQDLYFMET